ncbi:MAG: hypothetical protein AB8F34_10710 [Akkermansiaceae bacterium]
MTVQMVCGQEAGVPKKKKSKPLLRLLCVRSLAEDDKVILASKTKKGEWKEHQEITLRSPFITDWIEISQGVFYLTKRQKDKLVSLGSFTIPANMKRAIVVLRPLPNKKAYATNLVDPTQLDFRSGKALVMNFSNIPAVVKTGEQSIKLVQPGKKAILPITNGEKRMYRMLVGYKNKSNSLVACYDRYVSANPKARKFILVFPDPDTRLRVVSLSEFGPFK